MYPKIINLELRNEGTKPGKGFQIDVYWFEIFWGDFDPRESRIEITTGYDKHGDPIYEEVLRACGKYDKAANKKRGPAAPARIGTCFKFRGKTYDFMAVRPADSTHVSEEDMAYPC